jgi:mRNA-degrading endonuclease RelE of RelBE toxin-antitoxin system
MFVFTKQAEKQFCKLELRIQNQIKDKLKILKINKLLLTQNLKNVINMLPITHRIRIGSYRLLLSFDKKKEMYIVNKIAHRREVYK